MRGPPALRRPLLLRPALLAALAASGTVWGAGGAAAAPDGWSLSGALSEQLSLRSGGSGDGPRATTTASATLTRATARTSLALTGSVAPVLASDSRTTGFGLLAPSVASSLTHQAGPRTSLTAGLRAAFSSTEFTDSLFADNPDDPLDPGDFLLQSGSATQLRLSGNLGLDWTLGPRDSLRLALTASRTDFLDGATSLVPSSSAKLSATWSHAVSARLDTTLTAETSWFASEAPTRPETLGVNLRAGFERDVTSRLSLTGSLGVGLTETSRLIAPPLPRRGSEVTPGLTGDLGLTYAAPGTRISFGLSQSTEPSSLGEVQDTSALRFGFSQELTRDTSFGLDARAQLQSAVGSGGDRTTSIQIVPWVSWNFARDTSLRLGYTFASTSTADSHTVGLTLSRNFSLLQ